MPVYYSISAALLPTLVYLFLVWKTDKFEKEPLIPVLKTFLTSSTLCAVAAYALNSLFVHILMLFTDNKNIMDISSALAGAPVIEETVKGALLLTVFLSSRFDDAVDGIVYGAAAGFGFSATENFLYFLSYGKDPISWASIVITRSVFSTVMHGTASAALGAFLGYSKFRSGAIKYILIPTGFFIAIIIHFTWNISVSYDFLQGMGFIFISIAVSLLITYYRHSLKTEKQIIEDEIKKEIEEGIIPAEHFGFLISAKTGNFSNMKIKDIKEYKKSVIRLAFRKSQSKTASGKLKDFCVKDIKNLENFILSQLDKENGE